MPLWFYSLYHRAEAGKADMAVALAAFKNVKGLLGQHVLSSNHRLTSFISLKDKVGVIDE